MKRGEMARENSIWERLLSREPSLNERQGRVLQYIIHRVNENRDFQETLREPYVRRNCTQDEIDAVVSSPELIHACRERLERTFRSGELLPGPRRTGA